VQSNKIIGLSNNNLNTYGEVNQEMPVYILLEPEVDGTHWQAVQFSIERPESGTFLQGTVSPGGRVVCGIESYYVQEGTGHDYEAAIRNHKLAAEVAIGSNGEAVLKSLVVER
jgi:uncharacterized membrane-anchored protein